MLTRGDILKISALALAGCGSANNQSFTGTDTQELVISVVNMFDSNVCIGFVDGELARELERQGDAAAVAFGLDLLSDVLGSGVRSAYKRCCRRDERAGGAGLKKPWAPQVAPRLLWFSLGLMGGLNEAQPGGWGAACDAQSCGARGWGSGAHCSVPAPYPAPGSLRRGVRTLRRGLLTSFYR